MKLKIPLPKPRNRLALLARQRNAGIHGVQGQTHPSRTARRLDKQRLLRTLKKVADSEE